MSALRPHLGQTGFSADFRKADIASVQVGRQRWGLSGRSEMKC